MKWVFTLVCFNHGLTLVLFGQMAHVNACDHNLETSFFRGGALLIVISAVVCAGSIVTFIKSRKR